MNIREIIEGAGQEIVKRVGIQKPKMTGLSPEEGIEIARLYEPLRRTGEAAIGRATRTVTRDGVDFITLSVFEQIGRNRFEGIDLLYQTASGEGGTIVIQPWGLPEEEVRIADGKIRIARRTDVSGRAVRDSTFFEAAYFAKVMEVVAVSPHGW